MVPRQLEELEHSQPGHPFEVAIKRPNHSASLSGEGSDQQITNAEALTFRRCPERPLFDETPSVI